MKLFTYEGYKLTISEEAMLIKAFRNIVKRDKTRDKSIAMLELGYIYFMHDPRSEYMHIVDLEERSKLIIEQEGLPSSWKPDSFITEAILVYKELVQTPFSLLLDDVLSTVHKIRIFLKDIDLNEPDKSGKPKYTLVSVMGAIKVIPKLVEDLAATQRAITKEIEENGKMKANRSKKITEDGFDDFGLNE
jgi:hypothetical protein